METATQLHYFKKITKMQTIKCLFVFLLIANFTYAQNHCLHFDGIDDHVDLGNQIGNSDIRTIEMWFKPGVNIDANSHSDYTALIARNNFGENCEFGIFFSEGVGFDGKLAFALNITTGDYRIIYSDQDNWTAGTWYHVAATVDPVGGMKLYVNGVLQSETNPYTIAPCATDDITTLGVWGDASIRYFNGSIDEVRLWNFARAQTEIQTDMKHELTGAETGLISYYNFNQGLPAGTNLSMNTLTSMNGSFNGNLINFSLEGNSSNWLCSQNFSEVDFSNALHFDGIDDYVDLGDQIGNSDIRAIEMWFKPDVDIDANSHSDYTALIARNNFGENCEFGIFFSEGVGFDGKLAFALNITTGDYRIIYSDQDNWTAGTWYHVAATVDPVDGMKLYVNGVLQSETNPYTVAPCATDDITTLGVWGDANIRYFNGSIDEVRLWNFSRTQAEVQADMKHELTGAEAGLIAYYNFNQGESGGSNPTVTNLNDLTAQAFSGTLNNFNLDGQVSNWICSDVSVPTHSVELQQVSTLHVFPNPTSGNINIGLEEAGVFWVRIFDLTGKLMFQQEYLNNGAPIELSALNNGLYLVWLTGNEQKYMGKIVVHH
jgi:hypothetical protein